jgi:hypothetical protein
MHKELISNALLVAGVLLLTGFALLEMAGLSTNPLLPAFAAFFIGGTAVLDRVNAPQLK